jgi:hypothetical protein
LFNIAALYDKKEFFPKRRWTKKDISHFIHCTVCLYYFIEMGQSTGHDHPIDKLITDIS